MTRPLDPEEVNASAPPPAPAPDLISAARAHLAHRFAHGVEDVLWQGRGLPMPDMEAIQHIAHADAEGAQLSAEDLTAALIVLQAARLDLDHLEADLLDAALQHHMDWNQLAGILDLPDSDTARRHYDKLAGRRRLPVSHVDRDINPADTAEDGRGDRP